MKIVLGIPSGQRVKKLLKCIESWKKVCDFKIVVITWECYTFNELAGKVNWIYDAEVMQSFAKNHNYLAKMIPDWDVYICGADDLFPGNAINKIPVVCEQNPDKVIWVRDGLFDAMNTHPIITRGWYEKYGYIFDEDYRHNFTDTDLFIRTLKAGELVKCFDIAFDHRHPLKNAADYDEIYNIGAESFQADRKIFYSKHPDADKVIKEKIYETTVVSD